MDIAKLLQQIKLISKNYREKFNIEGSDDMLLLKIQEELGEMTQAYLGATNRNRSTDSQEVLNQNLADELADVFCLLLLFADRNSVNIEEAIEKKWLKYLPKSE